MLEEKYNGKEYLNVDSTSENKIGKKLSYESTFNAVNTLIGKITSIRTAVDYIITPNYPSTLLTKGKLNAKDIMSIPTSTIWVPNLKAITVHLIFERIYQDKTLLKDLMALDYNIKFLSFKRSNNTTLGLTSKVINHNKELSYYPIIINEIFKILKDNYKDEIFNEINISNEIKKLIIKYKLEKDVSLFHKVPFHIEFDDKQLNI